MPPERVDRHITVAVATMDRPAALRRCVDAILEGETRPQQLVIVDQSAGGDTAALVGSARWGDSVRVTYVRQRPLGLGASRNAAVAHATCPIVAFTDDDCVPDRAWLSAMAAAFDSPDAPDAVAGRILPLGPEQPGRFAVSTRPRNTPSLYRRRALPWVVGSGANAAVRREWLARVGGFDERLGAGAPGKSAEDADLFYRLLRDGATVRFEPAATVYHERQDEARRLASRDTYGYGMGAFCAKWIRAGEPYAVWMLGCWAAQRTRHLVTSFIRRRTRRVHEELLMLRGAARGMADGLAFARLRWQ